MGNEGVNIIDTLENAAETMERAALEIRRNASKYRERQDEVYLISSVSDMVSIFPNLRIDKLISGSLYIERSKSEDND